MNTKFNILWFEDEVTWFNMERLRIVEILNKHFLIPVIIRKDGDDFRLDEITGNEYDLILMDYKLAEGTTGDTIVSCLRENNILTDILFYSSEEQNMLSAIKDNMPPIDGVYFTKREYSTFTEKVEKLIGKIVRRSEDVVNLRGFVLDNTSDFEVRIKEILNICWQKFNPEKREVLLSEIIKRLDNKNHWVKKQVETAKKSDKVFLYANNDKYLLSIADRLEIMQVVLSVLSTETKLPDIECNNDFKSFYINKINAYRNQLGHLSINDKFITICEQSVEINQELHRLLRKNISDVDIVISKIEEHIIKI